MDVNALLVEAAQLMGTGMAVVFVFLTLLIFATKALQLIAPSQPEQNTPSRKTSKSIAVEDKSVIAAISAAVTQYRRNQGKGNQE